MDQTDPDSRALTAAGIPDAVQWSEGMLLTPQHFQQAALRSDTLLSYHAKLVSPFHWGVRWLEVDPSALVAGIFRVQRLEVVMPDGLVIHYVPDAVDDLSLSITPFKEEMQSGPVAIHLAVAARRTDGAVAAGELARYDSVDGRPVVDENTGEGEEHIPRLRPRLHLFAGPTPAPKYTSLPLAKVVYANEAYTRSTYVPPSLAVAVDSPIGRMCAGLAARLREKAAHLVERAASSELSGALSTSLETTRQIHALTGALPGFEVLLGTGVAHPLPLYAALWSLAGQVAGASTATVPPVPVPYDHNDPMRGFEAACGFVGGLLDDVQETYVALRFEYADGAFRLQLPEGVTERRLTVGVRPAPGVARDAVVSWMTRSLIGTVGNELSMQQRRITGAARERIGADPDLGLVPPPGVLLFGIEPNPEFIAPGEVLTIRNLAEVGEDERPAEIVLYVESSAP